MINLRNILLVEDNLKDVELTLEALKEHNLVNRVVHVHDGVEALDYLKCRNPYNNRTPENPSVILLDIKMPRMDGIELLEVIRSDDNLKRIPVVMLTSSREEPDLKICYKLGVNAYVVKPVNFVAFMDAVKGLGVFWGLINELPFEY
ncbi:MAG TPA: response regulator [Bacteroidales bacterium]|nr:response regulator [Bacteroidales bacterium]